MNDPQAVLKYIISKTQLSSKSISNTMTLLFKEDATIPFIARYRKEMTGELDEVQILAIKEAFEYYQEREKRKAFISEAINKQDKLTPALQLLISKAETIEHLEDIYAPYKIKKETKAQKAIKAGLAPLAELCLRTALSLAKIEELHSATYINPALKILTFADALSGAYDIIIEKFAHDIDIKETLRKEYWADAIIRSSVKKAAEQEKEYEKFKDYFEYEQKINDLKNPKISHRFLALRRGTSLKILKTEILFDPDAAISVIRKKYFANDNLALNDVLLKCAQKAYNLYIHPSLELEVKGELKKEADLGAISVFGINLKNLLLAPYLGAKTILGIDPGIRTGCKIVVVDQTSKLLFDSVIFPHESSASRKQESLRILDAVINQFKIKHIAVGNGTYGRETLHFLKDLPQIKDKSVKATMISEAGASIYSASAIAREEFPDKDITVRGAVSIARRFQDPLAELVKLDPKSIGVGQYQHDVNQTKLKKSLGHVVENCVNYVGVDLNTASASLLAYVSGIGSSLAKQITKHREKNGPFQSRNELLAVTRFGDKNYQQSAGFLRIYQGKNPLDATFIHPEQYGLIEKWSKTHQVKINNVIGSTDIICQLEKDNTFKNEVGEFTHIDIIKALRSPSQDPRSEFSSTGFRDDISTIKDLKQGQWYPGIITNITQFGAFVDIGIKENGLLHVSQMQDKYVENALSVLTVGEEVKVKVLEVDLARKRISLSRKSDAENKTYSSTTSTDKKPPSGKKNNHKQPKSAPAANAFSGLKNFKL